MVDWANVPPHNGSDPTPPWKAKSPFASGPQKYAYRRVCAGCAGGMTRYFLHSFPLSSTLVVQSYWVSTLPKLTLDCRKWGCNKWGLKGCLATLLETLAFSPFFCLFCPFAEGPKSNWKIQRISEEKRLVPQISSDFLKPPPLKPPFAALQVRSRSLCLCLRYFRGTFVGSSRGPRLSAPKSRIAVR